MPRVYFLVLMGALWSADSSAGGATESPDDFFESRVRPILAGTCARCHGAQKAAGGLRLDSQEHFLAGGDRGPVVDPRDPEKSLLIAAVRRGDPDLRMPPDAPLPAEEVAALTRWVADGAHWPAKTAALAGGIQSHWAFQPLVRPLVPADAGQPTTIDAFLEARRRAHSIVSTGLASRAALLRRATVDVLGMPPTPSETAAFVADGSPVAWARVVDRLLASPRFGERWGRHWLDLVRYADTAGDNADYPIPEARLYRDYVIDSFNNDKPYDLFVREQVAGDVLTGADATSPYAERVIATGFLALSRRYATAPYELWHLTLEDTIDTIGTAFLGLSLRCARCHDHKFDPITTADYYGLYGYFASTQFPYAGSEEFQSKGFARQHFQPLVPPASARPAMQRFVARVTELEQRTRPKESAKATDSKLHPRRRDELARDKDELRSLVRWGRPLELAGAYAVGEGPPVDVAIHRKGDPADPGAVVPRGVPKALAGSTLEPIVPGSSGRRQLAEWIARPENPLVARVMVNRIWQHYFGRGIVSTPSNLGRRGEPPSHPELLDWLADEFVRHGWSMKHIHRQILLSAAYQLDSRADRDQLAVDPDNRWIGRHERRRLDAESLRDAMLSASGALDLARPGDHPFPPVRDWHWTQHDPFQAVYPSRHRGVYLMTQRLVRHPYLALFDGPDPNVGSGTRANSNVPLQALYLMNNPFVWRQAEQFADRVKREATDPLARVELGISLAWCRPARPTEREKFLGYVLGYAEQAAKTAAPAKREPGEALVRDAWTSFARVLLTANEFLYVD